MDKLDYWKECISNAAEESGLEITDEQLINIARAVDCGHECYGMAFYTPPVSDRISEIERECDRKVRVARAEAERIRSDFVKNVCMRNNCDPSDVTLEGNGHATIRR